MENHGSPYLPLAIEVILVAVFAAVLLRMHEPPRPAPQPAPPAVPAAPATTTLSIIADPVPPECAVDFAAADGDAATLNEMTRKAAKCLGVEVLDWCDISAADRAGLERLGAKGRACP